MNSFTSVFVYGPKGCGKTSNAERMRSYFRLYEVIDDWSFGESYPLEGALILSQNFPWGTNPKTKAYKFQDVMNLMYGKK